MREGILRGFKNRTLQVLALYAPGATTLRVWLHRLRGVRIGTGVFIGTGALLETSSPHLVAIGNNVAIGIRSVIIAHFRSPVRKEISVRIENDVFIGPGVIILPNVTIGHGAVVNAGSVVTRAVPPLTIVQGNPAVPVARCGIPLGMKTRYEEFCKKIRPLACRQTAETR